MILRVLALCGALFACLATTASAQVPSLSGETFTGSHVGPPTGGGEVIIQSVQCNPDESGSFTYQTSGPATGPYPGTYVENGRFEFGPAIPGTDQNELVSFSATFRIDSSFAVTVVRGTKGSTEPTLTYGCTNGGPVNALGGTAAATYEATITPASGGTCTDSGASDVNIQTEALGGQDPRQIILGSFTESFVSETAVAECEPVTVEDCKDSAWRNSGFKNQGDCVSFVATAGRNLPAGP
jgi:hypothetical protein